MDNINGIPLIWDEEGDKKLFGSLFPNGLQSPNTNNNPFEGIERPTNNSTSIIDEIRNEIALESPFGKNSLLYKNLEREILKGTIFTGPKEAWNYEVVHDYDAKNLIKEFREENLKFKNLEGKHSDKIDFVIFAMKDNFTIGLERVLLIKMSDEMIKQYNKYDSPNYFIQFLANNIYEQQKSHNTFNFSKKELVEALVYSIKNQSKLTTGSAKQHPKLQVESSIFPACIHFYRSKAHADGKYGNKDTEYNGEFGFDKFDTKVSAEGTFSDYQPLMNSVPKTELVKGERLHLSAYASMYPPGVEGNLDNKKSKITVYILAKESKTKIKDTSKVRFSSSDPSAVKIVSNDTLTLTINDKIPQALSLECLKPFDKNVTITAIADGDAFVLGQLIIKANDQRYTTLIQPVEIAFSNQENLNLITINNDPLFKNIEKRFNDNSFNQAYIYGELAPQTKKIVLDKNDFLKKGYLFELNGLLYVKKEKKEDSTKKFNDLVGSKFTYSLNNKGGGNPAVLKLELQEQEIKLGEVFEKEFDYQPNKDLAYYKKKHQEKIVTKAWNHPKVQAEYQKYLSIKQKYDQSGGILPLNKKGTLYMFYSRDINGGGDDTQVQQDNSGQMVIDTVFAYSLTGEGVCYIFDSAFRAQDNITTILHEMGHSLGLQHTFDEQAQRKYEKRDMNKKYKQDIEEELVTLKERLKVIDEVQPVSSMINCQHLYSAIKTALDKKYTDENFETYFLNAILGNPLGALNSETTNQFYISPSIVENKTEIQNLTKEELKIKIKELERQKNTAENLVTYPNWKSQSETLENYMDYYQKANSSDINPDFERKSFNQKQWSIMQEQGKSITVLKTIN